MVEWRKGPILGRGSSATVSLATSSLSGELIAVKSAELSKSDLLQNEQSILSSLNCPQIISYLGFEVTPLRYNLFIEYAPGGSLSDHIKNHTGRLNDSTVRYHIHEILTGLSYLHSHRLVHCDIKPDNILVGSDGRAKIADLGCARWRYQEDSGTYQMMGTPMFMAPEVARGEEQGPAADVWALGCTMLEMATGRPPWADSDPIVALHRIAFSPLVPGIPSWVSDEGKDFLRRCLVRDPRQRWTADQLLKHPFVTLNFTKVNPIPSWSSPKSILDQDIWETELEEEEHEDPSKDHCRERLRELQGTCHGRPNWMWDESWIAIRSNTEGNLMTIMVNEDTVLILESHSSSIGYTRTQDVGNLFFQAHSYEAFDDNCDGISECTKGDEMQNLNCCQRDLISLVNKSFASEKISNDIVVAMCEYGLNFNVGRFLYKVEDIHVPEVDFVRYRSLFFSYLMDLN